jgi:hypothetical protein
MGRRTKSCASFRASYLSCLNERHHPEFQRVLSEAKDLRIGPAAPCARNLVNRQKLRDLANLDESIPYASWDQPSKTRRKHGDRRHVFRGFTKLFRLWALSTDLPIIQQQVSPLRRRRWRSSSGRDDRPFVLRGPMPRYTPTGSFFVASSCRNTYCRIPPFV